MSETPLESSSEKTDFVDKIDVVSLLNIGRRKKKKQDKHYATLNRRMLASTVDSLFLMFFEPMIDRVAPINQEALQSLTADTTDPNFAFNIANQIFTNSTFINSYLWNLTVQMMLFCVFSGICWRYWSATPGKMLFRMKIVDEVTERPISLTQIFIRLLGYWPSCFIFFLGALWIGIDRKKRGWHDLMAGTVVVTIPWRKKEIEEGTMEVTT